MGHVPKGARGELCPSEQATLVITASHAQRLTTLSELLAGPVSKEPLDTTAQTWYYHGMTQDNETLTCDECGAEIEACPEVDDAILAVLGETKLLCEDCAEKRLKSCCSQYSPSPKYHRNQLT